MLKRREFLIGAAGFAPLSKMLAVPPEAPAMRIGVMTDTHVGATAESCGLVRQALELFKAKGADVIVNNGDIADRFSPEGYRAYRQVSRETYGAGYRPQEIFAYAWHDAYGYRDHPRNKAADYADQAFEELRVLIEAPHAHTAEMLIKGYPFLVMPQFTGRRGFLSWGEYEAKVAEACKANPGKPVFVVDHVPPYGTVYNSFNWGCAAARSILDRYPQGVHLSGHVHGSLRTDLLVWQKNVTVINSVVKGEYLGWFSEGLTLINCAISGTQPLCYCKDLKLVDCTMEGTDLSFEYSDVEATVKGHIDSVKNPRSGSVTADSVGEVIMGDAVMECTGEVHIR